MIVRMGLVIRMCLVIPWAMCLLLGCAKENEKIVVPVAGMLKDRESQMKAMHMDLTARFPKLSPKILEAMESLPRGLFVSNVARHRVYQDFALPIGSGQSTLKPSELAFILSEVEVGPTDKVLEVGTGTGYMTAVLSRISAQVYSIEINEYLSEVARQNLKRLAIENVHIRNADGLKGWASYAPFNVVIISASIPQIPEGITAQLTEDARIAVPLLGDDGICRLSVFRWRSGSYELVNTLESHIAAAVVTQ